MGGRPRARAGERHAARVLSVLELPLRGPGGEPVDLWRTIVSHGLSALAPMRVDAAARTLEVTLAVARARPRTVVVGAGRPGYASVAIRGPRPSDALAARVLAAVRRVLHLDEDLAGFYRLVAGDPELAWAARGAGRMVQSPTLFEDVVKTICTTNCAWSATVRMTTALVARLGEPAPGGARAFPTPEALAAAPLRVYRDAVRAGYRGPYIRELARMVARGEVDLEAWRVASRAALPDEALRRRLIALPGVGPYAAAYVMNTMGRYSLLVLDSWTRPKYARLVGRRSVPDAAIERRFRRYGEYAGLAFWLFLTRDWVDEPPPDVG